jgi:hypothetical protein
VHAGASAAESEAEETVTHFLTDMPLEADGVETTWLFPDNKGLGAHPRPPGTIQISPHATRVVATSLQHSQPNTSLTLRPPPATHSRRVTSCGSLSSLGVVQVELMCGFYNGGDMPLNVTMLGGSLNSPLDFRVYVQNWTSPVRHLSGP